MLIGRFGKMSLRMGVEGNGESAQNFGLFHSGLVAAEFSICMHMVSRRMASSPYLINTSGQI